MLVYYETVESSTLVLTDHEGDMMWVEERLEFSKTVKGGRLAHDDAMRKWDDWCRPDNKCIKDQCGPGPELKSKIRCWVHIRDKVIFRNQHKRTKGYRQEDKGIKNASDEDKSNNAEADVHGP